MAKYKHTRLVISDFNYACYKYTYNYKFIQLIEAIELDLMAVEMLHQFNK